MAELFDPPTRLHIETFAVDDTGAVVDPVVLQNGAVVRHVVRVRHLRFVPMRFDIHAMAEREVVAFRGQTPPTVWTRSHVFRGDKSKTDEKVFDYIDICRHPSLALDISDSTQIVVFAGVQSEFRGKERETERLYLDVEVKPARDRQQIHQFQE